MPFAPTMVIAHRGFSSHYPENTMAAFEASRRPGVDALELDVQLSGDGVPVVFHDRALERIAGDPRVVRSMNISELAKIDVGRWKGEGFAGERIPLLEEMLAQVAEREVWIEIKVYDGDSESRSRRSRPPKARRGGAKTIGAAIEVVEKLGAADRVRLLCFDRLTLDWAAERAPGIRRVWNLKEPVSVAEIESSPRPDAVDIDVETLTPEFADQVRSLGLPLFVYTCNTDEMLKRALDAGVSGIISDRPDWLLEQLAGPR